MESSLNKLEIRNLCWERKEKEEMSQSLFVDGNYVLTYLYFKNGGMLIAETLVQKFLLDVVRWSQKFAVGAVYIAWDDRKSWRRQLYSEYKKHRCPDKKWLEIREEVRKPLNEVLEKLPWISQEGREGLEADDLIWGWTRVMDGIIVSGDKDLWQCVRGDEVKIWLPSQKKLVTADYMEKEFGGIIPYLLLKCLVGDRSDNLVGVASIGWQRARRVVKEKGKELYECLVTGKALPRKEGDDKYWLKILLTEDVVRRNWQLIKLDGEQKLPEKRQKVTLEEFRRLAAEKGMSEVFAHWEIFKLEFERLN